MLCLCIKVILVIFLQIYVSHGSVVRQLNCEGIFNEYHIAYCPHYVPVKEL